MRGGAACTRVSRQSIGLPSLRPTVFPFVASRTCKNDEKCERQNRGYRGEIKQGWGRINTGKENVEDEIDEE